MTAIKKIVSIVLIFCLANIGYARSTEQIILEKTFEAMSNSYADEFVKDFMKGYLDDIAKQNGYPELEGMAGELFSVYSLFTSMENFDEAEGDQKNLAGANVFANVVSMANPVIGGTVKVVLMVVGLIMSVFALEHQKTMIKYSTIEVNEYTKLIQEHKKQALAEIAKIKSYFKRINGYAIKALTFKKYIEKHCLQGPDFTNAEIYVSCYSNAQKVLIYQEKYLKVFKALLATEYRFIPMSNILKSLEKDTEEVKNNLSNKIMQLEDLRESIQSYSEGITRAHKEAISDQIMRSSLRNRKDTNVEKCIFELKSSVIEINRFILNLEHYNPNSIPPEIVTSEVKNAQAKYCIGVLQKNDGEKNKILLRIFANTMDNLESTLRVSEVK